MYLKRLEIQGFKSFADSLKLDFSKEITAVVGPNGSGKSNIADAVRWVLGEQSPKTLRGAKMEDVIFSGTQNRKPLGFAEVSIILDNTDGKIPISYGEVTITRRVYRSGESEYSINRTSCRLKDIHELFMDTGVGKEGYSIIGQGQIDRILSTKPEERRFLFEEAVGIVKYKNRKIEAEKKLELEKQNLTRVEDIISELKNQIEPLLSQAEKAKKYLDIKEKLKQVELNLFVVEADTQKNQIDSLEETYLNNQEELLQQKEIHLKQKGEHGTLKEALEALEDEIFDNQNNISDIRTSMEKKEGNNKVFRQQIEHCTLDINRLQNDSLKIETKIKELENEKAELSSKANGLSLELKGKKDLLQEEENHFYEMNHYLLTGESEIENYKSDIIDKMNESSELKSVVQKLNSEIEYIENRKEQITSEQIKVNTQYKEQKIHLKALNKLHQESEESKKDLTDAINELTKINNGIINVVSEKTNQLNELTEKTHHIKSRKQVLEQMEKEYDGFYKSVKNIMLVKKNIPEDWKGIYGVVAELIQVPKGYETAIEVALGSSMQNIVTNTEEDAKNAICYLKKKNLGRATFLPLSAIKSKSLGSEKDRLLHEKGFLGIASSIIHYDKIYNHIISYLLGRVIIVDNLDKGIRIAKKYNHKYKIVTINGEVLNPGGSMTGGSIYQKTGNIFLRTRELNELKNQLNQSIEDVKTLKIDLEKHREIKNENLVKIDNLKEQVQKIDITLLSNQHETNQCQEYLNQLNDKKRQLELEEEQITIQYCECSNKLSEKLNEMNRIEKEIEEIQSKIEIHQVHLQEEKVSREALSEKITKLKIEISSLQQDNSHILENINRLENEIKTQNNEKEQRKNEIQIIHKDKLFKEKEIQENTLEIEKLNQFLLEIIKKQDNLQNTKKNTMLRFKVYEESIEKTINHIELLQQEINRIENKKTKLKLEQEVLYNKIWEEYEETYRSALNYKSDYGSISEMKKISSDYKSKIKDLGNINLDAIDEYGKVKERYTFLSEQKEDILDAEKKLFSIIKELTASMEKRFIENFATISLNFNEVFTELFGGGKGYLQLTDEENVLESGIEIIAQPPGKKLQNMMLLSGGEKALTAIALLFSILIMKPSPFCILDEIEAALDDANVNRFSDYLQKFHNSTQFIVITHRKGTMEAADTLYGVTMEEQGISKLLSVKLSDITDKEEAS